MTDPPKQSQVAYAKDADVNSGLKQEPANAEGNAANQQKSDGPAPLAVARGYRGEDESQHSSEVASSKGEEQQPSDGSRLSWWCRFSRRFYRWITHSNAPGWAQFVSATVAVFLAWLAVGFAKEQAKQAEAAVNAANEATEVARAALWEQQLAATDAKEDTTALVNDSHAQVRLAREQNAMSREQMMQSLRAWVTFDSADTNGNRLVLKFVNSGKTPALKATILTNQGQLPTGSMPSFKYEGKEDEEGVPSKAVIGPGAVVNASVRATINPPFGLTQFVYGKMNYSDIFGGKQWLKFCVMSDPIRQTFSVCERHNDTGTYEQPKQPLECAPP